MRILVTGATGNVGRLVVDELLALGATEVRALTRHPAKAALPPQVDVVEGYLGDLATMPAALDGVDLMYLAPLIRTTEAVCRMAADAGVRHIVDLAGLNWQPVADAVAASGVPWTHLEPGEFMTNTQIWAPQIAAGDVVRDVHGDAANAPIALEDVAAVAARILVDGGHIGRAYELTGPETLTRRERVAQIGAALGRELIYVELDRDAGIQQLSRVMGEYAEWYVDGQAMLVEHPQPANQTVAALLGRPATTFAEWARRHREVFENPGR
jgi:uncharacterized protein YbjT (DUF2867 family)